MNLSKGLSIGILVVIYLAALAVGFFVAEQFSNEPLWLRALLGDVAATVLVFACSRIFGNSSVYDPYWSVIPLFLFLYFLYGTGNTLSNSKYLAVALLLALWGGRLTGNFLRGWPGMARQDWRYDDLKQKHGGMYWVVSFLGVHLLPTVLVFAGMLPTYGVASMQVRSTWGLFDVFSLIILIAAVYVEWKADEDLHAFKKQGTGGLLKKGIWAYSRHPNYFGEILFWVGLFAFALAQDLKLVWTGFGAIAMILLFVFISIPMMERRMRASRGDEYNEYVNRVSMLIPLPPRRSPDERD